MPLYNPSTSSGGAPTTSDYLVGTSDAGLSAEIVVGTSPGGELGGTWASPTIDATHSGSTHAATQAAAEATASSALTTHAALSAHATGIHFLRTASTQTINAGAATFVDITGLTFSVTNTVNYAFEFYITFQSANTATGWKAGVNCPNGTLDFWAGSDIIANGAAGVATHTERHNTARDDMTLLTSTVTQAVDLNVRIKGRYLCTQDGTFAARFANELVTNTDIVIQAGSWGWWA